MLAIYYRKKTKKGFKNSILKGIKTFLKMDCHRRYKNLPKDEKQRLVVHRKNYSRFFFYINDFPTG